ncbi:hypothetical protein DBV14_18430 [Variovorax sp. KBW07]|uniref:TagK domain-containing protein n=1 Tax=Variovorax sp. KBW07 TaxID=2153358 RepID=UPI000F576505|nr:TagK domain-containing protein [Variovorax sp. KBW07]RQO49753.1 hypothetical protein DBV14_18430 [Variovorax sp. KBW07]
MSISVPRPNDELVASLCLRLTHSGGEARQGAMRISSSGVGMADALQLCGERQSEAQWRVANMCRIGWRNAAEGWQLTNDSFTLMCVHNGKRVEGGASVLIALGDTLELGLLRFMVDAGADERTAEPPQKGDASPAPHRTTDTTAHTLEVPEPGTPLDREPPAFDLRDLAARAVQSGSLESQTDALADPFGMLDIAGVQSRPTADVLAELLGEIRRPTASAALAAHTNAPPPARDHSTALLDELHDEFVRVVRDPDQLAGRTDWEGFLAFDTEPAPSLDELRKQAEPYALLRDILQPREHIDRTIDDFEPLAKSGLLDTAHPEDALGLFAPELVRDGRAALPSLTRREHHELSPDSHVHIGAARASDDDSNGAGHGEGPAR